MIFELDLALKLRYDESAVRRIQLANRESGGERRLGNGPASSLQSSCLPHRSQTLLQDGDSLRSVLRDRGGRAHDLAQASTDSVRGPRVEPECRRLHRVRHWHGRVYRLGAIPRRQVADQIKDHHAGDMISLTPTTTRRPLVSTLGLLFFIVCLVKE